MQGFYRDMKGRVGLLHSRKLTWKPKKGPIKTTVLLKGDYLGFHVSLGECSISLRDPSGFCRVQGIPPECILTCIRKWKMRWN